MSLLRVLHLVLIGAWLGCVAVEFILENAPKRFPELKNFVPLLHYKIDQWVEIPIVLGVLTTGWLMLDLNRLHGVYLLKVICGGVAVLSNLVCWIPVSRRQKACLEKHSAGVRENSIWIFRLSALGIPAALVAFGCGLLLLLRG